MADQPVARVKVWDIPVRVLHWLLALTAISSWLTGHYGKASVHEVLGYAAGAVVVGRFAWGFIGGSYARFTQFVRGPRNTWNYVRYLGAGREPRYLGHNPLGGWMAVALLACVAGLSLTGVLYTTDWLWGYAWLEALHSGLAWLLLVLVPAHLAGVVFTSLRHRENLPLAMWTGYKQGESGKSPARSE